MNVITNTAHPSFYTVKLKLPSEVTTKQTHIYLVR